ncbi:DUF4870 domain-containing protein [Capnocytophaga sp.]|uniref:DUF4870 domain-containing protein n=1 Tax=Capnocytophaga sp. TaxID=44737 RepID=UPI0026DAB0A1|nr:DUF4870 domain-containing protein [Capnocytophaga sp.]MDO5106402.1 DUF4870 domain-containing protein [Capnocytophaga sp.]
MITIKKLNYRVSEGDKERASNSYLMSVVALMIGMPLPILNLVATFVFFLAHRKSSYFVRWHCTQALFSQLSVLPINVVVFWWTISILFAQNELTNTYIAYVITAFLFNFTEFITTIYTAAKVRKGVHLSWWFYGDITDLAVKQ